MIDMWVMNSVTFVYSHCFLIVGFELVFICLAMLFSTKSFDTFFAVSNSKETPDLLVTMNVFLFCIATHVMIYNMNIYIKMGCLRER